MAKRKYTADQVQLAAGRGLTLMQFAEEAQARADYVLGPLMASAQQEDDLSPVLLRDPRRSREANSLLKGAASFVAGLAGGYSLAKFGQVTTAHLAAQYGGISGTATGKLLQLSVGLGVASIAPEGPYGWGMTLGAAISMIPALRNPPTPSGLLNEAYSAARGYVNDLVDDVGEWMTTQAMNAPVLPYLGSWSPTVETMTQLYQPIGGPMGESLARYGFSGF